MEDRTAGRRKVERKAKRKGSGKYGKPVSRSRGS